MRNAIGLMTLLLLGWIGAETGWATGSSASVRKATLAWQEAENAAKYEVELSRNRKFSPALRKQAVTEARWTVELDAGTYYFRVRPLDAENLPGPWSDIEGFVVNPYPPQALLPAEGAIFQSKLPNGTLKLEWTAGIAGTQSIVEIKDAQGPVLKRPVDGNSFSWKPQEPGSYQWRAGYISIAGTEWSPYRNLTLLPEALGIVPVVAAPKVEAPTGLCQKVSLLGFQAAGLGIMQSSGGKTGSAFASWNPRCSVSPFLDLAFSLGGSALRGSGPGAAATGNISLVEAMGWAVAVPSTGIGFSFGIGGGAQTWLRYGTYAVVGGRLGFRPGLDWLAAVEELFVEYGYLSAADKAQLLKAGLVLRWGNR